MKEPKKAGSVLTGQARNGNLLLQFVDHETDEIFAEGEVHKSDIHQFCECIKDCCVEDAPTDSHSEQLPLPL